MDRPTIKDVARLAGVSFKTVSRVINHQAGVAEGTRARVMDAIDELGYMVNHSARTLASGRSRTLGVVIPRLTDPHVFRLLHDVGQECETHDLPVMILTRHMVGDGAGIVEFVGHGMVGALLLVAPSMSEAMLQALGRLSVPVVISEAVCLDDMDLPRSLSISCVASDSRCGAREGVEYLLALGHRRIAYISGTESSQSRLRLLGCHDALAGQGLNPEALLVARGDWSWESGAEQAARLLQAPNRPTAIFCANDNMALGAMHRLNQQGLRVPADVSVLGFDGIPAALRNTPALTTVAQPTRDMVRHAVGLLHRALEGQVLVPENRLLPTRLVLGASCQPYSVCDT